MRLIDADDYRERICEQLHMPMDRARLEISTDYEKGLYDAARLLNTQPTIQPEIIRCKDCVLTDGHEPIADGRYWCMLHGAYMHYCLRCRKEN